MNSIAEEPIRKSVLFGAVFLFPRPAISYGGE